MAAPNVNIDPTQYTSAANSVNARITATLEELGRYEVGKAYFDQNLDEFFGVLKGFIEIDRSDNWLADYTEDEDGDSSFTWDLGEYATGKLAEIRKGYSTVNEPVTVNSNALFSVKEIMRNRSMTDNRFKMHIAEKVMKAHRDIVNGIIGRFLVEVLNKVDSATATYLHPDGKPTLGVHTYNSGYSFDNLIKVGATPAPTALNETALDALRAHQSDLKDSSGQTPYPVAFDTLIVAAGSANEKAAFQLMGITDAMAVARAAAAMNNGTVQPLFPQEHGLINIYQGQKRVISVKGMDKDLWLAVDSTAEAPIKLRIVSAPTHYDTVVRENGTRLEMFFGAVEFWAKLMPITVAGSRG